MVKSAANAITPEIAGRMKSLILKRARSITGYSLFDSRNIRAAKDTRDRLKKKRIGQEVYPVL